MSEHATFWVVGTPLGERQPLDPRAREILPRCRVVICESRKVAERWLKTSGTVEILALDPDRPGLKSEITQRLKAARSENAEVALFSDGGMPCLFDPGGWVLEEAKRLKFRIAVCPAATSWGTACAVSGYPPPFQIEGFPPRETEERLRYFQSLKNAPANLVFLETPYRFQKMLGELVAVFGPGQAAFLAWDISLPTEVYLWGTLQEIKRQAEALGLKKGEFIWVLRGKIPQ